VHELSNWIKKSTQMTCSVGVSCNIFLAKVACPLRKPAGITVLTKAGFQRKRKSFKIEDMPSLGGVFGAGLKKKFYLETMHDLYCLVTFNEWVMREKGLGMETIMHVRTVANGDCNQQVIPKEFKDTISSSKSNLGIYVIFFCVRKYNVSCITVFSITTPFCFS